MTTRGDMALPFLAHAGWGDAQRQHLAGDASDRSYDRLFRGAETAVLMDAPPGKGDDPASFVKIAEHLLSIGLSAPRIFAADYDNGFLLIEDLGDGLFARLLETDAADEMQLYAAATDVLLSLQGQAAPAGLPDLSAQEWADAAGFALTWYRFAITGDEIDPAPLCTALADAIRLHADDPRVLILRDYHAENLLWLPERAGVARVGLLDFQLGQMGQAGYDLVSLLQDARRDVSPDVERAMITRFSAATCVSFDDFSASYAVLGAQRALRILGIFARLCLRSGKPHYVALIPRVWGHLRQNLSHPALALVARICDLLLPEPTADRLARIGAKCGTTPHR